MIKFACTECTYKASVKSNLVRHLRTVHEKRQTKEENQVRRMEIPVENEVRKIEIPVKNEKMKQKNQKRNRKKTTESKPDENEKMKQKNQKKKQKKDNRK